MVSGGMPKKIRVSLGSAMALNLSNGKMEVPTTTAYLLTYRKEKCTANCGFCPQARSSQGRNDMLSRVSWPVFPTSQVLESLDRSFKLGSIRRVCLQALNYPDVFRHLTNITEKIESIPISVSCQPLVPLNLKRLLDAGVNRISIPLDAATEEIFERVKGSLMSGPYLWKEQFRILRKAVEAFGKNMVSTHLIVGLGETEKEMVETIQRCVDMGVIPALFAFTPIPGTYLENNSPPSIPVYRRIQVARHLIFNGITKYEDVSFDEEGRIIRFDAVEKVVLSQIIHSGKPFLTTGCPDCNRPYYNEKPGGPIYNYPRPLTEREQELNLGSMFEY